MISFIGNKVIRFFSDLGGVSRMTFHCGRVFFRRPFPARMMIDQMIKIGWNSLPVIFFTALATGAILAYQSGYAMSSSFIKGSEQFVGGIVSMTIASELGPVLCAIMVGARAGSGITAEIGTMKVTEQLDALVTLSEDPVHYLVLPRVISGIVMVPVLTIFTDMVAILGGSFVAIWELGINQQQYIDVSLEFLTMKAITDGLIKSAAFGFLITIIASFEGFRTRGGAEGVGMATTRAVVVICMSILFFDYLLTTLLTTITL